MSYLMRYKYNTKEEAWFNASYSNDVENILELIEKGADITLRNQTGQSALDIAAFFGNIELFKVLLANGADINGTSPNGDTVLDRAQRGNQTEMTKFINMVHDKRKEDFEILCRNLE